jgi:hypothetical protein
LKSEYRKWNKLKSRKKEITKIREKLFSEDLREVEQTIIST